MATAVQALGMLGSGHLMKTSALVVCHGQAEVLTWQFFSMVGASPQNSHSKMCKVFTKKTQESAGPPR